jgi:hypothetical protein
MPVRVDPALMELLHDRVDVRFVVRSPDLDGLNTAMPAVIEAIWQLNSGPIDPMYPEDQAFPSYVSEPARIPGGRLLMIDFNGVSPDDRTRMPTVLTAVLAEHGVTEATLETTPALGDRYANLDGLNPLVRTWLHDARPPGAPRFTARPSDALLDTALAWLRRAHRDQDHLLAVVHGVELPLSWSDHRRIVADVLAGTSGPPTRVLLLSTDFTDHAHAVHLGALNGYGVLLTSGQRTWTHADIGEWMHGQRDLVRHFPGRLEWAGIMLDYTARTGHLLVSPHQRIGPDHPTVSLWYQLLSPAQLDWLGGMPVGAIPHHDGGAELTIGEPEDWIPGTAGHRAVTRRAQELLTPPRRPGVRIGQRLLRTAARSRTLVLSVRAEPPQLEAVRAMVERLRTTAPPLRYVSDPAVATDGLMVVVDASDLPEPARRQLSDRFRAELETAGVTDADLDTPPEARPQPYLRLARFGPAVHAWLYAREPVAPDRRSGILMDAAFDWLRDQHQTGDRLVVLIESVEFPLTWDGHRPVVDALLRAHDQRTWTPVIETDGQTHAAYVDIGFAAGRGLLLTANSSSWADSDLATQMWNLRRLVDRHAAELDGADITLDANFFLRQTEQHPTEDVPMWYRLLPATRHRRLDEELPEEAAVRGDGRVELAFGEPHQWVPNHPDRDQLLRRARRH